MRGRGGLLAAALLAAGGCGEEPKPENLTSQEVAEQLSAVRVEPGLWELTSEVVDVRAPELPLEIRDRMIGPRSRQRHCISAEQAARPSANFLAARGDSLCSYRRFSVRGGVAEGVMTCPDAEVRMRGRYGPRTYDTRMEMRSPMPGGATMTLQIRARGRRLGPCNEGERE